jgi:hypothetical protein
VCTFDSYWGHVETVEVTEGLVAAVKAAECEEYCCTRKETPEAAAARKERRKVSYDNAVRLLHFAEKAALENEPEQAKAFSDIAGQWDSIGY